MYEINLSYTLNLHLYIDYIFIKKKKLLQSIQF